VTQLSEGRVVLTVTILDTVTGETRTNSEWDAWWWFEGNGSCDCNRRLIFEPDAEDVQCGEARYYIIAAEGDTAGYEPDEWNRLYPPMQPG
jgi:hypothetical protein